MRRPLSAEHGTLVILGVCVGFAIGSLSGETTPFGYVVTAVIVAMFLWHLRRVTR